MKRRFWFCLLIVSVCMTGCNFDVEDGQGDDTYDEMTSTYTLLTVSELWTEFENENGDYDGSYVLVEGVLLSVGTNSATMLDSVTQKAVTCSFDTGLDLTDLENALSNNSGSGDEDIVTVGGVCHYYEDTTSYPYLGSCDYFYVNSDE